MSNTVLLMTGIVVFGLMLIGVVLTAMEFSQVQRTKSSTPHEQADLSATTSRHNQESRNQK